MINYSYAAVLKCVYLLDMFKEWNDDGVVSSPDGHKTSDVSTQGHQLIPLSKTKRYVLVQGYIMRDPVHNPYYVHILHNCHHINLCHPPVKQCITTHRNTEFIVMDSPHIMPSKISDIAAIPIQHFSSVGLPGERNLCVRRGHM